MNKNRIGGLRWRASEHMIAKPISIKLTGDKSGGWASKAVELTREICGMSQNVNEGEAIHPDRVAEVGSPGVDGMTVDGHAQACTMQAADAQ